MNETVCFEVDTAETCKRQQPYWQTQPWKTAYKAECLTLWKQQANSLTQREEEEEDQAYGEVQTPRRENE